MSLETEITDLTTKWDAGDPQLPEGFRQWGQQVTDIPDHIKTYVDESVAVELLGVSTTGDETVELDFSGHELVTNSIDGNITYTSSNLAIGRSVTLRVVCDGTTRSLTFPSGWVFVGEKPTDIAANKVGVLGLTSFGNTDAEVVAAWAVQE